MTGLDDIADVPGLVDYVTFRAKITEEVCDVLADIKRGSGSVADEGFTSDLISDDQPIFGRGLEFDSLMIAELATELEAKFGIFLTDDDRDVLASVNRLVDAILVDRGQSTSHQT